MANYSANQKPSGLDVLTTLATDDVIVVGDTSDSGKAKAITQANLLVSVNGAKVAATATDITPGVLDDKIIIASADSSVTVTKTVQNSGANEKISYDLSTSTTGVTTTSVLPAAAFPTLTEANTLTSATNTTLKVGRVFIPARITTQKISITCKANSTTGTVKLALFSDDGQTRLFSVTTASISATGIVTTSISSTVIPAGYYYIAILPVSTSDHDFYGYKNTNDSFTLNNPSGEPVYCGTITVTADTMPTTITPTSITSSAITTVIFRLDN